MKENSDLRKKAENHANSCLLRNAESQRRTHSLQILKEMYTISERMTKPCAVIGRYEFQYPSGGTFFSHSEDAQCLWNAAISSSI